MPKQPKPPRPPAQEPPTPTYPIPLNEAQERAAKEWAADDRLWTTQETVETNLRTFARVVLRQARPPAPDALRELADAIANMNPYPRDEFRDRVLALLSAGGASAEQEQP